MKVGDALEVTVELEQRPQIGHTGQARTSAPFTG